MVARKLRFAKNPGEITSKRRKVPVIKKRPLKRPLLVVNKKDGEYNVTMETMKGYSKQRAINQPPYEDKPVLSYTIGRTEEENRIRKKKKTAAMKRLEREQREFIQSAFRHMCQEICLKTYQQALGILPDAEDPECPCFPALPAPQKGDDDRSCTCSADYTSTISDTDCDEWILEFTPPNAFYDANYSGTKVKTGDKESQYTHLDYMVKLLDRFGNPVPRFFKGPNGEKQCSDLGGFWSPDHNWLEINVDGYIAPDLRWAPMTFIGPNGDQVDTSTGKFLSTDGQWLVVGVDGYVGPNNKWVFYKPNPQVKRKSGAPKQPKTNNCINKGQKFKKDTKRPPAFCCFGDATPVEGIVGHGPNKRLLKGMGKDLKVKGGHMKLSQETRVPRATRSPSAPRKRSEATRTTSANADACRRCHHLKPSSKGMMPDRSYATTKKHKSLLSKERLHNLEQQGRSLSAFHEPCFHSSSNYKKRPQGSMCYKTSWC